MARGLDCLTDRQAPGNLPLLPRIAPVIFEEAVI
jgi:hypothetical protein